MIPVQRPTIGARERDALARVLESRWLGHGSVSEEFEERLKEIIGTRYVLAVNTGTSALHLALACLDLKADDEVLLQSLTFAASAQAVLMAGGTPVFCEVLADTLNLDPADVAHRVASRSRAVMPAHFGGLPCEMGTIETIAKTHSLAIVEDAAHAFGSTYQGRAVGALGDLAAFSFDPIKNITCGEGGAVATNVERFAEQIRLTRNLGIDQDGWARMATPGSCADSSVHAAWRYTVSTVGFRYHLPNLNAALGLAQLDQRNHMCERKRQVVARYDEAFQERPGLALVTHNPNHTSPFFYVLRVLDGRRASMMRYLADRGVGSSVHYIPNHLQPLFTAADQPALPSDRAALRRNHDSAALRRHHRWRGRHGGRCGTVLRAMTGRSGGAEPATIPHRRPLLILGTRLLAEEVADLVSDIDGLRLSGFVESRNRQRCQERLGGLPIHWVDELGHLCRSHQAVVALTTTLRADYVEQAAAYGIPFGSGRTSDRQGCADIVRW